MKNTESDTVLLVRAARKAVKTAIKYGKVDTTPPSEPKTYRCERGVFKWTYNEPSEDTPNGEVLIECDGWKILHAVLQPGWQEDQIGDQFITATYSKDSLRKRVTDFMNIEIP